MARPTTPIAERFWSKVDKRGLDECWPWTASVNHRGYGRIKMDGRHMNASRVSYILHKGPLASDVYVLHRCNNPVCVNPNHLRPGTHQDNMDDKVDSGRSLQGEKHHKAKVNAFVVRVIRRSTIPDTETAEIYGLCPSQVGKIRKRQSWRHVE